MKSFIIYCWDILIFFLLPLYFELFYFLIHFLLHTYTQRNWKANVKQYFNRENYSFGCGWFFFSHDVQPTAKVNTQGKPDGEGTAAYDVVHWIDAGDAEEVAACAKWKHWESD